MGVVTRRSTLIFSRMRFGCENPHSGIRGGNGHCKLIAVGMRVVP